VLEIRIPKASSVELSWICHVLFEEWLGLDYVIRADGDSDYRITYNGRYIELPNIFFGTAVHHWLKKESLPVEPLIEWDMRSFELDARLLNERLPVLYGDVSLECQVSSNKIRLPIDIFGSAFFMLSRYEEVVCLERDRHDRFPAVASLANRQGFLNRPIIDEYVEVLWAAMQRLWPTLARRPREFRQVISCDVDKPLKSTTMSMWKMIRCTAGDVLKRRSMHAARTTVGTYIKVRRGDMTADPFWQFDWIMDTCERADTTCAFYFITESLHPADCMGYWGRPSIEALIGHIYERGHEVGLHTSYTTFEDPKQTKREFHRLLATCERLGVKQDKWGGRQHVLRWRAPTTWRNWDEAGLDYDSTLTFADAPGFRCGTCQPYPVFDVLNRQPLRLVERPLIVMDCSVLADRYQGLNHEEGLAMMRSLKNTCQKLRGEFSLLWHNSYFRSPEDKTIYTELLLGS